MPLFHGRKINSLNFIDNKIISISRGLIFLFKYEGYPENKFRLRILPMQRCGHDGAHACRVC